MGESVSKKYKWWFESKKALLVEDNELAHDLVRVILKRVGISIDICVNGVDALDAVQLNAYDVVLMDIQMPIMDGLEATREIRNLGGKMSDLPIIAMSANVHPEDIEMAHEAGMNAHVGKPMNKELLYETLSQFLNSSLEEELDTIPVVADISPTLPMLAGIDTDDGIQRIAGNMNAYIGMLRNFYAKYVDSGKEIETFLQHGQFEQAAVLAHNIKGNGGNIGAKSLHLSASELELACKEQSLDTAFEVLPAFQKTLAIVISSLNTLPKDEVTKPQWMQPFDPVTWSLKSKEYIQLLDMDFAAAMDGLEELKFIAGDKFTKEMSMLEKYIEKFDVDTARRILLEMNK
ncbi:MAG: response regulator [Gammaproteobacteria bacterium]|nr:response regulator [Gammaproteobacteria bacterium]